MLNIGQSFTSAVRLYGGKGLVIAFHLSENSAIQRVMIADRGIDSRNAHSGPRTVSLHRRAIVAGLIKERAAQECTACVGYLIAHAGVNCRVPGIGINIDQTALGWRNQSVTVGPRHIDARLEIPARDLRASPCRKIRSALGAVRRIN